MSKEIEIRECQVEDVDNAIRELWLGLAREMYEIEHVILPSKDNCVKWINYSARAHNTEWSRQLIQKNNLEGFFDAIVISSQLGIRKPHQDIFLHCLKLLRVKRETAMYIGDSLFHDVRGAKNAGITCVWLNRKNELLKPDDPQPDYEIHELTELLRILF